MRHISKKEFSEEMKKIKARNEQIELRNKLREERNKVSIFKINKVNTSTKILISVIVAIVSYTIISLYIQYSTGVEVSDTLTTLWFSFWTVEIAALAGIKITKVIKDYGSASNLNTESISNSEIVEPSDSYERNDL